ncbi:uncharacterized protein LOC106670171 [Cimex lectularius]|uniref:MADF domain-containing protein n=1 Tax=Cimex lectularius TaxID=79782 RepID=A0A8I6S2A5_CIMLE|nr:uncharacterized protein LOC106670171 [Cimex lectularius]
MPVGPGPPCNTSQSRADRSILETITEMDSVRLIDLIQPQEPLWNPKNPFYHNREKKNMLWTYIAAEMGFTREAVKTKWCSLRDSFRRELKKRSDPDHTGQGWSLFEKMSFLTNVSGIQKDFNDYSFSQPSMNSHQFGEYIAEPEPSTSDQLSIDVTQEEQDNIPKEMYMPPYGTSNLYNKMMVTKRLRKEQKKDEDYHFLMSLFSSLKRIPAQRKLEARIKMMRVVSEMLQEAPPRRQNVPPASETETDLPTSNFSQSPIVKEECMFINSP